MGYALFAQRKIVLTGQINTVSLQQTQRSNEQYMLATQTLSLQQQMTSMQSSQAFELSLKYEELARVGQVYNEQSESWESAYEKKGDKWYDANGKEISSDEMQDAIDNERNRINADIKKIEQENQAELDEINRQIYLVGVKENAIELEVKRLDTAISALQKQLEAVEEAEGSAIDRATPKFNGVG
ncbi:MAG: hypothetical protein E7Z90_07165 [Cyanobacteria bacterium SIG29]|nr:hypothetical protein [Cyanobacteria bacterium SIG29]